MARDILLDENLTQLSEFQLREIISRSTKILSKVEQYVVGADKPVDDIKSFIYQKIPPNSDIPSQNIGQEG